MSFELFGHQWEDGALDKVQSDIGKLQNGESLVAVVENLQGTKVHIRADCGVEISVEAGAEEIDKKVLHNQALIAKLETENTKLAARKAEILGS